MLLLEVFEIYVIVGVLWGAVYCEAILRAEGKRSSWQHIIIRATLWPIVAAAMVADVVAFLISYLFKKHSKENRDA